MYQRFGTGGDSVKYNKIMFVQIGLLNLFVLAMVIPGVQLMASLVKASSGEACTLEDLEKMKLVTKADGKTYFAENAPQRTWIEASAYCNSIGMKLATVETPAQFAALKAAYSPEFSKSHWTFARDAMTSRQFSWHESNEEIPSHLVFKRDAGVNFQTCLVFYSNGKNSYFYPAACVEKFGTLCEKL